MPEDHLINMPCALFRKNSGWAVGCLKVAVGAGGAVVPAMWFGPFGMSPSSSPVSAKLFSTFIKVFAALAAIALSCSLGARPGHSKSDRKYLIAIEIYLVCLAGVATSSSIAPANGARQVCAFVTIALFLGLIPLFSYCHCRADNINR